MLDVVNDRLVQQGEHADRVRSRLSRGHLRLVRADDQRRRPRAGARHRHLPAAHAALSRTATRSRSSRGGRARFRSSGTWSSTGPRSTGSSRPAASSRSTPAARGWQTPSRSPRTRSTGRWTPRSASAAARAWRRAPTGRPRSSPRPRSRTSACCRRASPSGERRALGMVAQMDVEGFGGCTLFGECQEACPEADRNRDDLVDEPRLPAGDAHAPARRRKRRRGIAPPARATARRGAGIGASCCWSDRHRATACPDRSAPR